PDGEGDHGGAAHDADDPLPALERTDASDDLPPGESEHQQGDGAPDGERDREHDGGGADASGRARGGDRREHRTGAGDEDGAEREPEQEAVAVRSHLTLREAGEGPLEETLEGRDDQREPEDDEGGESEPSDEVGRQMQRRENQRAE